MAAYRDIQGLIYGALASDDVCVQDCDFNCEDCRSLFDCNVILEFHEFWDILTAQHRSTYGETGNRPH